MHKLNQKLNSTMTIFYFLGWLFTMLNIALKAMGILTYSWPVILIPLYFSVISFLVMVTSEFWSKRHHYMKRFCNWAIPKLQKHTFDDLDLVVRLILSVSNLQLVKEEFVELSPIGGTCGPIRITGTTMPMFEYVVFDMSKNPMMMEFVRVRVIIAAPNKILYSAAISAENTDDKKRHGEEVKVKEEYKRPFKLLSSHIFYYFPLYTSKEKRNQARKLT